MSNISTTCAELALVIASPQEPLYQCALCIVRIMGAYVECDCICVSYKMSLF
ncbi:hypothetical protein [Vibrio parahaemolyticus]|uniref:hypothetical protein n=1 Tax=Vibrio parahaemolyticus TaxID=670 RepID=UPI001E6439A5|nr:hypothetical protein [Vibrio parahaemolyticus]